MISMEDVRNVCDTYLSGLRPSLCHAIASNTDTLPRYNPRERRLPICEAALNDSTVGGVCSRFYRSLPLAAGRAECPFGVMLLYQRATISGQAVCSYQQIGCTPRLETARDLPRNSKKLATDALAGSARPLEEHEATKKFDRGRDLLATLATGRVAESIRALSHHLLTPLQGALADADLLDTGKPVAADVRERLTRNLTEVDASAKQIQILMSEHPEFSAQKLRKVSVAGVMRTLIDSISSQAQQRSIRIDHNTAHARSVEAIPDQFTVVLSNLLQNSVKYSFDDRVVRIMYMAEGDKLAIRFQNEGCAIEADEISDGKIFQLGYRGRGSSDRGRTGTGTGLYIAKQIADTHDASIRVTSKCGALASDPTFQTHNNRIELVWPVYSRHRS